MPKGRGNSDSCQRYLNNKIRINNKTRRLEKRIKRIEVYRELNPVVVNPNTKQEVKRKDLSNITRVCRIGREKESFQMEDFKKGKKKR